MPIAREGLREIIWATLLLGALAAVGYWLFWPAAILPVIVWLWVISFFRNPRRRRSHKPGDLCSPADGRITEVTELDQHDVIGGPAVRIGMFLSIFDVHANRSSCGGTIRSIEYKKGEFLDARHVESGVRNEANTLVIDPEDGMPGPIVIRQVAGKVARRICCHVGVGDRMEIGQRFGMIKFGSRTELILPRSASTEVLVSVGDQAYAGLTILARQPVLQ
jgi:phosphatidylserine decarboxylase